MQAEDLDKITNDFVCGNSYFSSQRVKSFYVTGCNELWNGDSRRQFPAKLEDGHLHSGIHGTLFLWPLKDIRDTSDLNLVVFTQSKELILSPICTGFAGNNRVVFDVRCRFHGVVTRRETNYEHCIELSEQRKTNIITIGPKEYKGYRCKETIFTEKYVRSSAMASWQANLEAPDAHRYPYRFSSPLLGTDLYEWPIFKNDLIFEINNRLRRPAHYFVWYKNKGDPIQVIFRSTNLSYTCKFITMNIVPHTHYHDSVGSHQLTINMNKKSYDCNGQIFTDYYLKEIQSLTKNLKADSNYKKFIKNKYPKLMKINQIKSEEMVWIWRLRISEGERESMSVLLLFMGSANDKVSKIQTRYFLIMSYEYEIIGVYYTQNDSYTACNKNLDQTISEANDVVSRLDLNNDYPCCERCKDPTGCSCEENWHIPKRQKISHQLDCN
ncbi:putative effector protein [Blumeria hordei DH14]|uniref:Putative effector protein n=1 Tax=Blumeria graminis f. sp. hordei (strain DH14) TaxID=546991 RepID=N1JP53_BLUG1|nr:putative effector protein [Blumeria hordei DH14]